MSNIKYFSGDFTVAMPVGILRNESPLLPELNDVLIFHQDYVQLLSSWGAQDYNTLNPDLLGAPAYLFNESEREDFGGGVVRWTRSWARVPSSYGKAGGTYPYPFPGFDSPSTSASRDVIKKPVAMEILRDFFLCGLGGVFDSWQEIPIIPAFQPYEIQADPADITCFTDTLRDPDGAGDLGTFPSISQYKARVAADEILDVEDSKVTNFRGGIYMRERYTVRAQ
jgi:hypothetical protein